MLEAFRQWWRPREYHVEYFRGSFGMCGYHDKKVFTTLKEANDRLQELGEMDEEEVTAELEFQPTFLRIIQVQSPRLLNACGRKRAWRFNIFGWKFII